MTNKYNLFPPLPKLVLIHGLNNNRECFSPLQSALEAQGFSCQLVTLPGHGEDRYEAGDFESAYTIFKQNMQQVSQAPWVVVAFSTGALYLQHWLKHHPDRHPLAQVLLAPALFIRRFKLVTLLARWLPPAFKLRSWAPAQVRRYPGLEIREYKILLEGLSRYRTGDDFLVPTLMLIDPRDELVDATKLGQHQAGANLELIQRPYLWKPGHHHLLFHPDYFSPQDWQKFIQRMANFLQNPNAEV
jgi:alpha-beta hydrolase superfamily lysophospholipase